MQWTAEGERGNKWDSKTGCYPPARRRKNKVDDGRRTLRRRCRRHKVRVQVGEVIVGSYPRLCGERCEMSCILGGGVSVT